MFRIIEKIIDAPDYFREVWSGKLLMLDLGTFAIFGGSYVAITEGISQYVNISGGAMSILWTFITLGFAVLRGMRILGQIKEQRIKNEVLTEDLRSKKIANDTKQGKDDL